MKSADENIVYSMKEETAIPYEQKIAFLNQASSYAGTASVEVKETYMSVVFLTEKYVYKLKKPVKNHVVDFVPLANRYRNCCEEVRLNRRLAKDVYIGVIPLTLGHNRKLGLAGNGTVVDWLVKMKRLPAAKMLDNAIRNNSLDESCLRRPVKLLCEFYKRLPPAFGEMDAYIKKLKEEIKTTCRDLGNAAALLPLNTIRRQAAVATRFIDNNAEIFKERVLSGKIIEGHGDLRPEHIYIGDPPAIIDCLEFSRQLRILDVAEELSFLAIECEIIGDSSVEENLFQTYSSENADKIPAALINFYKLKRAVLRVYLNIRHITEAQYKDEAKWLKRAQDYLNLAEKYSELLTTASAEDKKGNG